MTTILAACLLVTACDSAGSGGSDAFVDCGEASAEDCDRCGPPPRYKVVCPKPWCPFHNPPSECYAVCSAGGCVFCDHDDEGTWAWAEEAYDCTQD